MTLCRLEVRRSVDFEGIIVREILSVTPNSLSLDTPGKINMEPENGPLEDYFPLQPSAVQVPC